MPLGQEYLTLWMLSNSCLFLTPLETALHFEIPHLLADNSGHILNSGLSAFSLVFPSVCPSQWPSEYTNPITSWLYVKYGQSLSFRMKPDDPAHSAGPAHSAWLLLHPSSCSFLLHQGFSSASPNFYKITNLVGYDQCLKKKWTQEKIWEFVTDSKSKHGFVKNLSSFYFHIQNLIWL